MKVRWLSFLLILVVVIFFGIRFLSDVYLSISDFVGPGEKMDFYTKSHTIFPFDHTPAYEYGSILLKAGYESKNNTIILESIDWFKKAVSRNPFHYYSHYYLGKSYFFYNYPHGKYFNEAVAEFKKAAFIRGSNLSITLDTCKVLLSMWPILSEKDKQFCRELLLKSMDRFSWDDFSGIIEPWWLYSKDEDILEELLEKKPVFFYSTAEKLTDLNAPLSLRWDYLAKYENYLLDEVSRQFQSLSFQKKNQPENLIPLLEKLDTIEAYYMLAKDVIFNLENYRSLKNKILHLVITALVEGTPGKNDEKMEYEGKINRYIYEYINGDLPREQVLKFKEYLKRNGFFKPNDFKSLYFAYLLELKLGNFGYINDEIERLKNSITYINEDKQGDYIQLLLLLADSYQASKLLSSAEKTLNEIIDTHPDNLEACFSLLSIHKIIGGNGTYRRKIKASIDSLKNSRNFEINSANINTILEKTVFLLDHNSIQITLGNGLPEELKTKLLQVFADGRIKFENYISLLPPVIQVEIKSGTGSDEMSKHRIRVRMRK